MVGKDHSRLIAPISRGNFWTHFLVDCTSSGSMCTRIPTDNTKALAKIEATDHAVKAFIKGNKKGGPRGDA
ncbi:MAG: hypothetical protein M1826_001929 [Phylliscum demangeonii]|nr:MAG: hypothetical protein M1826_001929 [Phylliscum demangeonii]